MSLRWNPTARFALTQFENEERPRARLLRCCAASIRRGDPALVTIAGKEVIVTIVGIECSVVLVRHPDCTPARYEPNHAEQRDKILRKGVESGHLS